MEKEMSGNVSNLTEAELQKLADIHTLETLEKELDQLPPGNKVYKGFGTGGAVGVFFAVDPNKTRSDVKMLLAELRK